MTDARLAGVARETLASDPTAQLKLAGVAREALISGTGLGGTSRGGGGAARGELTLSLAGVTLSGHIAGTSSARYQPLALVQLSGRIGGRGQAAASMPFAWFEGRIGGRAKASAVMPVPRLLEVRAGGRSRGRLYFAPQASHRSQALTLNIG